MSNAFGFGGEDSFFATKRSGQLFVGVADGVGHWRAEKAKDAAKYAQELMRSGLAFLSTAGSDGDGHDKDDDTESVRTDHPDDGHFDGNTPRKMAHFAWHRVTERLQFDGASTLCLVDFGWTLSDDIDAASSSRSPSRSIRCRLNAFNLGDSGFCVYRVRSGQSDYELLYRSPAQEQGLGVPYQLGSHPTANAVDDGLSIDDLALHSSDVVVIGTDGLWDNLWDHEIARMISESMAAFYRRWSGEENAETLSFQNFVHRHIVGGGLTHKLVKEAYLCSIDRKKATPWSEAMTNSVDMVYSGGKPDDITCVVVFVH